MLANFTQLRASTVSFSSKIITRGKRTARQAPGASRVINMLSVLGARKKMPRRLKLSTEDVVRHQTVAAAWKIHQKNDKAANKAKMELQYNKIQEACEELKKLDPALFEAANAREAKRFPVELRVPTDTPPRVAWESEWVPMKK